MLFSLLTIARCQDWTCDECAEGGAALGEFLSSEENIFGEIFLLITEICPQHPDPDYCAENLPTFWATVGPMVWRTHFSYICADLECPSSIHEKVFVPNCEACLGRVNSAADALAWEETITGWITGK